MFFRRSRRGLQVSAVQIGHAAAHLLGQVTEQPFFSRTPTASRPTWGSL